LAGSIFLMNPFIAGSASEEHTNASYLIRGEAQYSDFKKFEVSPANDNCLVIEFSYENDLLLLSDVIPVLDLKEKPRLLITFFTSRHQKSNRIRRLKNGNSLVSVDCSEVRISDLQGGIFYRDQSGLHKLKLATHNP